MRTKCLLSCCFLFWILCHSFQSLAQGPGKALSLNGNAQYVEFNNDNRGVTGQVTVEAWIKTTSFHYNWIAGKYNRGYDQYVNGDNGYHLIIQNGRAAFNGRDGGGAYRQSGYSQVIVSDDKWHHLAGVCDRGIWQIYVDGVLQSETRSNNPSANLQNNIPLTVGSYYLFSANYFMGTLDEIRIWKRALNVDEIRTSMCTSASLTAHDLVAYFKFDETSGTTVTDHSTFKLNGVLRNINAASARVTSGAAIGDKSVFLYPVNWQGQKVEMVSANGTKVWINNVGSSNIPRGLHLYYVGSKPNSTTGLNNPQLVNDYYGIFPALTAAPAYKLNYTGSGGLCSSDFFSRNNNSVLSWSKINAIVSGDTAFAFTDGNRMEVVLQPQQGFPLDIADNQQFSICYGETVLINAATPGASYQWSTGSTAATITATSAGDYWVDIVLDNCSYKRKMQVVLEECPFIPNIITPNGDGLNDTFTIKGLAPENLRLEIYNRWGKQVFQSDRYENSWSAADVTAGMYYYLLKSSFSAREFKGWVQVVK